MIAPKPDVPSSQGLPPDRGNFSPSPAETSVLSSSPPPAAFSCLHLALRGSSCKRNYQTWTNTLQELFTFKCTHVQLPQKDTQPQLAGTLSLCSESSMTAYYDN